MASIKKFSVSVNVNGKVRVSSFFNEIVADSQASAIRRAVSMVCANGMLSPRINALLKEAVRRCDDNWTVVYKKIRGIEVYVWSCENRDEDKGE